jgi:hypothetical protein
MKAWSGALVASVSFILNGCANQQTAGLDTAQVTPMKGSVGSLGATRPRASSAKSNAVTIGDRMTCKGLENAIDVHVTKLVALKQRAKAERDLPAPTVEQALTRMFGQQNSGNQALSEVTIEQDQLEHYSGVMQTKGCAPVDITAKIATTPSLIPVAKPVSVSGNKT